MRTYTKEYLFSFKGHNRDYVLDCIHAIHAKARAIGMRSDSFWHTGTEIGGGGDRSSTHLLLIVSGTDEKKLEEFSKVVEAELKSKYLFWEVPMKN